MKTIENQGFLTTPDAMGRSGPVKTPAAFQIANEISGFEHVPYGTALRIFNRCRVSSFLVNTLTITGVHWTQPSLIITMDGAHQNKSCCTPTVRC